MSKQFPKTVLVAITILSLLFAGCQNRPQKHSDWIEVQPGLQYARITFTHNAVEKELVYISIDPKKFRFQIYENKNGEKAKSLQEIQQATNSLVTFNGTFFDTDFKPLGLLINQSKTLHPISKSQLSNGIFEINKNGQAELISSENFQMNNEIDFAIQNGPMLLNEKGDILFQKETGKTASRTLLGKDKAGNVILIILRQSFFQSNNTMTLYEAANFLKNAPEMADFGLNSMLNLDGGPSTGAVINGENLAEINPVENAVTVSAIIAP